MTRFAALAVVLVSSSVAQAGAYSDRIQQAQQQVQASEVEAREQAEWRSQLSLQKQVQIFASKHGGLRDAGECTPYAVTTCGFLGICVPVMSAKLTVAQLSTQKGRAIDRCEVALGDGSACELSNDADALWNNRTSDNRVPKLKAVCLDSRNQSHETYQF